MRNGDAERRFSDMHQHKLADNFAPLGVGKSKFDGRSMVVTGIRFRRLNCPIGFENVNCAFQIQYFRGLNLRCSTGRAAYQKRKRRHNNAAESHCAPKRKRAPRRSPLLYRSYAEPRIATCRSYPRSECPWPLALPGSSPDRRGCRRSPHRKSRLANIAASLGADGAIPR